MNFTTKQNEFKQTISFVQFAKKQIETSKKEGGHVVQFSVKQKEFIKNMNDVRWTVKTGAV